MYKKILLINTALLFVFLFFPGLAYKFYLYSRNGNSKSIDGRALYPIYDKDYSINLFQETLDAKYEYLSFIGWRRKSFQGKLVNIDGKFRNRLSINQKLNNSVWFFGGSTMWGEGSEDKKTIPSIYSVLSKKNVFNFGESGWTSRNSTAQLINLFNNGKNLPKKIVFYDGLNEIVGCRNDIKFLPLHDEEFKIIEKTTQNQTQFFIKNLKNFVLDPYLALGRKFDRLNSRNKKKSLFAEIKSSSKYICSSNIMRTNEVASQLINNWYTNYILAKDKGIEFYAILQPTLYSSNSKTEYLPPSDFDRKDEYTLLYDVIRKKIQESCNYDSNFCARLFDGSKWINTDKAIFFDIAHKSELGNEIVANKIFELIN